MSDIFQNADLPDRAAPVAPALKAKRAPRSKKGKRGGKRIIIVVLILAVLAAGFFWLRGRLATPAVAQDNLTEFTVARGNVTRIVSGPGAVSPVKIFTIATNLTGDIAEDYFEEGDEVEKDGLLYRLDEETTSLNFDAVLDALNNAQDNYQSTIQNKSDLVTLAKQGGLVDALYVKKGDQVNSGSRIADIIDHGRMLITLPFNTADAAHIRAGDAATVYLDDYGLDLHGRVQKVASGQSISSSSAIITNVEIVFDNPGALAPGGYGTAIVGEYACNNEGMTEYAGRDTIYAAGSGKITGLYISEGDRVSAGQTVLIVENSTVNDAVTRAAKSVADAEKKLTNTQNNLQITSPIAGTVLAKSAKAGDTLYNTSTTLAVVADMSRLTFTIDVDELEIRYLQAGQQATVTADAYEGERFAGIVTNVGKTGTSNSGVTTYPVTIEIEEYGGLLPGMNVNAEIVVQEAINVLYIPVAAVTRGNLVLVKDDGSGDAQQPMMMMRGDGQQLPGGEGQGEGQQRQWSGDQGDGQQRQWSGDQGDGQQRQWSGDQGGGQQRQWSGGQGDGQQQQWDDSKGGESQQPVTRGNSQGGGQQPVTQGDGQGGGQQPVTQGDSQGGGQQPVTQGNGQGGGQQPVTRGQGQGGQGGGRQIPWGDGQNATFNPGSGFMGATPPEGYIYRRVETGISDSNYVEIISGLSEGDIIAYRPAVQDTGNRGFNMMMGPGGGMMYRDGGGSQGNVVRAPVMR